MSKKFLSTFFRELAYTARDMGEAFTLDFYLHRGRKYNLYYPDDHERFKKGVYNLKQRGYVKLVKNKSFKFTKKGKKWYQKNSRRYSTLREANWDRKWRVVFFDIPEEFHKKRDSLRRCLKNLGFHQLQKSILVTPFKCENEVAELCSRLKVASYTDLFVAESVGSREDELKKIFEI